jgi:hypothetical protein
MSLFLPISVWWMRGSGVMSSNASADALIAAGARVRRGSLDDIDSLRAGAADADGVIHLAFKHDFGDFAAAGAADLNAVQAMGDVLAGSGRPLVTASGTLMLAMIAPGRPGTEDIAAGPELATAPRVGSELAVLAMPDGHFGFLGAFVQLDNPTSTELTRQRTGWQPTHPGLIADLEEGHYFTAGSRSKY